MLGALILPRAAGPGQPARGVTLGLSAGGRGDSIWISNPCLGESFPDRGFVREKTKVESGIRHAQGRTCRMPANLERCQVHRHEERIQGAGAFGEGLVSVGKPLALTLAKGAA